MMRNEICVLPLSGAESIDANCYFLKLGANKILLDCGSSSENGLIHGPNFLALLQSGLIHSLQEITHVFISHAHMDHVGYLPQLLKELPQATVYMTPLTEMLTRYQLFDSSTTSCVSKGDGEGSIVLQDLMTRIRRVNFLETLQLGSFKVSFFQAGHIPGAMMTLFEYRGKRLLYTGDYSFEETTLTCGCLLPENLQVDYLLLCATHAHHPWYNRRDNVLKQQCEELLKQVEQGESCFCSVRQLSKGIELMSMLNQLCEERQQKFPFYLDGAMLKLLQRLEIVGVPLLKENNFSIKSRVGNVPHLTISMDTYTVAAAQEHKVNIDFSLHDDYEEMKDFICKLNPAKALLVHCAPGEAREQNSLQEELLWEPDCHSEIIYCQDGKRYGLNR